MIVSGIGPILPAMPCCPLHCAGEAGGDRLGGKLRWDAPRAAQRDPILRSRRRPRQDRQLGHRLQSSTASLVAKVSNALGLCHLLTATDDRLRNPVLYPRTWPTNDLKPANLATHSSSG